MRSFGKILDLLIAFLAIITLPILSALVAKNVSPFLRNLDPDRTFVWISIHHTCQFVLTIFLMKIWYKTSFPSWGFNLNEYRKSLRIFGWFSLIYLLPIFLVNVLPYLRSGTPPSFLYQVGIRNIAGILGFQFLLSGSCEEPLFRGFVMTLLDQSWNRIYKIGKIEISSSGLWATFLFMLAHMGTFSVAQQIWSFGLGLYYAIIFHKTKSLLGPILSHGYSNGIIFVALYVLFFTMKQ